MSSKCIPQGCYNEALKTQEEVINNIVIETSSGAMTRLYSVENTPEASEELDKPDETALYKLPFFIATTLASILEDSMAELRILEECNNSLRICKMNTDMPLHLMKKFAVEQPKLEDELDEIKGLEDIEHKFNKLDADRKYFGNVCKDAYMDLSLRKSYYGLAKHVKFTVDLDNYRIELQDTEAKNRLTRRELYRQLRQQRNHIKTATYDTENTIEALRSKIDDSSLLDAITSRYVEGWQRARTEQHKLAIYEAEYEPLSKIDYFKQRSDHEQRVHAEVELVTNLVISEKLEQVEFWMEKYEIDMEAIDLKTQIKKNEYQDMRFKRICLEETIAKHDQMMKEWIEFKEARAKARAYTELMTKSAIMVQAWWRGMLVRKQLGPYKEPKKKKEKKKPW